MESSSWTSLSRFMIGMVDQFTESKYTRIFQRLRHQASNQFPYLAGGHHSIHFCHPRSLTVKWDPDSIHANWANNFCFVLINKIGKEWFYSWTCLHRVRVFTVLFVLGWMCVCEKPTSSAIQWRKQASMGKGRWGRTKIYRFVNMRIHSSVFWMHAKVQIFGSFPFG